MRVLNDLPQSLCPGSVTYLMRRSKLLPSIVPLITHDEATAAVAKYHVLST